ncbi:hypothetical protein FOZ62_001459 [Perkinsus olseni]|uniref:Uncharacterized protein n=1 Tax=Perkinsus olseni TaxID=32597 RepID=A0A7J6T6B0_PEROL|nr:hypothetical protein FOZ62_001459 [Perkinsus olseni]
MGGDGGSLPARSVMVKTRGYGLSRNDSIGGMGYGANHMGRKEEETIDNKRIKQMRMQYCTLSHTLLYKNPVVVCRKGNMYSKEALYTALLEGKTQASSSNSKKKKKAHDHHHADGVVLLPKHIKKIKDVRTATIEWIDDVDMSKDRHCTFRCPITRKDLDDGSTSSDNRGSRGIDDDDDSTEGVGEADMTTPNGNRSINKDSTLPPPPSSDDNGDMENTRRRTATITKRTYDERKEYIDKAMKKLRRSAVYDSMFGDNSKEDTDAFGRGF